jgi:hypothetical protein
LLGAALVALVVGSAGAYRFLLLFPAAALYTLVAVYGTPPLSLSGWRRLFERVGQDVYEGVAIAYATPRASRPASRPAGGPDPDRRESW